MSGSHDSNLLRRRQEEHVLLQKQMSMYPLGEDELVVPMVWRLPCDIRLTSIKRLEKSLLSLEPCCQTLTN